MAKTSLTSLAISRPVTTFMLAFSMLLLGLAASRLLPLEKFPGIDIPEMVINAPYQGSSPAEVERLITKPIEEALATMGGIKSISSSSSEHGADVQIEVAWESSLTAKGIEAREKIDAIRHLLPDDLERIFVYQFSTSDMPILTLRISSERDLDNSYDLLNNFLKKPLERINGISKVSLYGVDPRQISIRLDSRKMASHRIELGALDALLSSQNFTINAGAIRSEQRVIRLRPDGEFKTLDDIKRLRIRNNVYLGDIATIDYEQPEREDGRHLDQRYAIGVDIFKESGANLVATSAKVTALIDEISDSSQFNGINIYMMQDQAQGVTDSLSDLLQAGAIGALLSFAVLYLFIRNSVQTLLVVASVPFSICIALACMYLLGYSLNVLSLMGLLLAVGMLVDNSVVITESVSAQQQKHPQRSVIHNIEGGVSKVSLAVITGTFTTMIVFLPNIIGEKVQLTIFLEHVAIAICISLAASLLIAKTLLPLLLSKLSLTSLKVTSNAATKASPSKLALGYKTSLNWALTRPKLTGVIAVAILASTAIPISVVTSNNDNNGDKTRIVMRYHLDGQYPLEQVEAAVTRMEKYLYDNQKAFNIDAVYSYYNTERATSSLLLVDNKTKTLDEIKKAVRENMPEFTIAKPQFGWRSAESGGASISLLGASTDQLVALSHQIIPMLAQIDGLVDVRSDISERQQELILNVNRVKARKLGLTSLDVAQLVGTALRGKNLRSYRHDPQGEVKIQLLFDQQIKYSLAKLKQLPITQIGDQIIHLENVVDITIKPRLSNIYRENRQTSLTIGANLEDITTEEAGDKIKAAMKNIVLPQGTSWKLGRGFERQQQEQSVMLVNMLLALAMIYIVMAALFESLLLPAAIISSILYSIVGVFWAFLLTGTNMSVMGMIGILILMGIVVNNGIVLIDQINQMSPKKEELVEIIGKICESRLRPVLMTVSTTVLGMIPLAMGGAQIGGDGPSYGPLAIAIIGGLTFSTVTSLYLVPWCYLTFTRLAWASEQGFSRANLFAKRLTKVS